ncbi:NEAT domain-containing protein [Clostridium sp. CS001]|uniref:NEAT domain-containing protein n=1 Tax=Clostridium sp. CS001 TaxID=2880648 RepID=UPI001CF49A28|nr:NEAT domain-containing protein [Clostridium sp. CS001]MCB2289421.1 NEAT domain-containing protein [Clostridium sp. CS001]
MKTISRKLTTGILTAIMTIFLLTGAVFAAEPLKNGEYTIDVQALTDTGEVSKLADAAITKPVKLNVIDGKMYVTLTMKESMSGFSTGKTASTFEKATVVSQNTDAKTITYKFLATSIDEPILTKVTVAAMGRDVNFKISFDRATIKDITPKPATPVAPAAPVTPVVPGTVKDTTKPVTAPVANGNTTTPVQVSNPKTADNSFSGLAMIIAMASIMSITVIGSQKIKNMKSSAN